MKTEEIVAGFRKYIEDKDKVILETTINELLDFGWNKENIDKEMPSILVLVKQGWKSSEIAKHIQGITSFEIQQEYYNEFFSNEIVIKLLEDLKQDGRELRKIPIDKDIANTLYNGLKAFYIISRNPDSYIYESTKQDYNECYRYLFCRLNIKPPHLELAVPMNLILFFIIKYFPEKLGEYLFLCGDKKAEEVAKILLEEFNQVFQQQSS